LTGHLEFSFLFVVVSVVRQFGRVPSKQNHLLPDIIITIIIIIQIDDPAVFSLSSSLLSIALFSFFNLNNSRQK